MSVTTLELSICIDYIFGPFVPQVSELPSNGMFAFEFCANQDVFDVVCITLVPIKFVQAQNERKIDIHYIERDVHDSVDGIWDPKMDDPDTWLCL